MALAQKIMTRCLAHGLEHIQLLVKPFGSNPNSGFSDLGQPFGAMPWSVHRRTATGNGPAAV